MIKNEFFDEYIINMTSQTWLTANDSDRSVWWHYLAIIVPHKVSWTAQGTLYITGMRSAIQNHLNLLLTPYNFALRW